jgi:hypothetical protein
MKKFNLNKVLVISILSGLLLFSGCDKQVPVSGETGFLEGVINIGPLCPVQKDPPDPACLPTAETYKAYPVSVWTSDGKRKLKQIVPELSGDYNTELQAGNYMIILEKNQYGIGRSSLPVNVTIFSNDTTKLDIDIDTGIR